MKPKPPNKIIRWQCGHCNNCFTGCIPAITNIKTQNKKLQCPGCNRYTMYKDVTIVTHYQTVKFGQ